MVKTMSITEFTIRKIIYIMIGIFPLLIFTSYRLTNQPYPLWLSNNPWILIITAILVPAQLIDVLGQMSLQEMWRGLKVEEVNRNSSQS